MQCLQTDVRSCESEVTRLVADTEAICTFLDEKVGHFEDYVSSLAVFADRVEITIGWRDPRRTVVRAREIAWVRKGSFAQKNVITIMPVSGPAYELVADWDRAMKLEIIEALKSITPVPSRTGDGGASGTSAGGSAV